MKKLLFLFLFGFLLSTQFSKVNAQPYKSIFGNNSTSWNVSFEQGSWYDTDSLVVISDTVIDSMNFKIIEQLSFDFYEHQKYYIREDTNSGKYYIRSINDLQKETLFMDLGLNVGDTFVIRNSPFYGGSLDIVVDSVYYLNNLKVIKTNYPIYVGLPDFIRFYESIGPNIGLNYLYQVYWSHANYSLQCNFKDDTLYFHNPNARAEARPCYASLGVFVPEYEKKSILKCLYPNPTNSCLNIEFNSEFNGTVVINNLFGQIIFENRFENISNYTLNVGDFESGVYFISFLSNDKNAHVHFVKQ